MFYIDFQKSEPLAWTKQKRNQVNFGVVLPAFDIRVQNDLTYTNKQFYIFSRKYVLQ